MGGSVASLIPLLLAVFILMCGNGLVTTLVPLRGSLENFGAEALGLIGSAYFVGMLAGTWATPVIVGRAGHIRAFAAYAALAATATLGFSIAVHPVAWMGFRLIIGFCFAGLFTIIESWINDKATNQNRGRLLAVQNIVHFSGSASGQQLLRADDPRSFTLFSGVAAFFMLSLVPMALTRQEPPPLPARGRLEIGNLFTASPVGAVGMVLVGLANATFWSLVPAYVERLGLGTIAVSTFMTAVILGSAVSPYPVGRLSDRVDRRFVIVAMACLAVVTQILLLVTGSVEPWLYVFGFVLGACLPVLYVLISAHTNDRVGRERMVNVSSTLLFLYCLGGIVGPMLAAFLMARYGDRFLFVFGALAHAGIAGFVLWRILARPAPAEKVESAPEEKPLA